MSNRRSRRIDEIRLFYFNLDSIHMMINRRCASETTAIPGNSLLAATPEEGLRLAKHLAQETRRALREDKERGAAVGGYLPPSSPATGFTPLSPLVLSSFAIVAAANNYWR